MGLWRATRLPGNPVPADQSGAVRRTAVAGAGWAAAAALALLIGLGGIRLVGESLTGTPGGVLSAEEVERALAAASEQPPPDVTADAGAAPPDTLDPAAPIDPITPAEEATETADPTVAPPGTVRPADPIAPTAGPPSAFPTTAPATTPGRAPATTEPTAAAPVRRTFSARGGTAIAACQGTLAALVSWSPTQGHRVERARPGPATEVEVRFEGEDGRSEMKIRCAQGIPVAEIRDDD